MSDEVRFHMIYSFGKLVDVDIISGRSEETRSGRESWEPCEVGGLFSQLLVYSSVFFFLCQVLENICSFVHYYSLLYLFREGLLRTHIVFQPGLKFMQLLSAREQALKLTITYIFSSFSIITLRCKRPVGPWVSFSYCRSYKSCTIYMKKPVFQHFSVRVDSI